MNMNLSQMHGLLTIAHSTLGMAHTIAADAAEWGTMGQIGEAMDLVLDEARAICKRMDEAETMEALGAVPQGTAE